MHWFVSQSIFLIAVERTDPLGIAAVSDGVIEGDHYSCVWSLAVLLMICGWVFMFAGAISTGWRKYKPGMNRREGQMGGGWSDDTVGTGHCKFSSGEPAFPQEGVAYK